MTEKSKRTELTLDEAERVAGGQYINTSMTVGQIISEDSHLLGILTSAGIPAAGNRKVMNMSLQEVAELVGTDANVLENKMNDYLSSK